MLAKEILLDMCQKVVNMPNITRISRTINDIRISLHMNSFTDGIWTLQYPDKGIFTTHDVNQCEIALEQALSETVGVA
jgi:hypothetical protein